MREYVNPETGTRYWWVDQEVSEEFPAVAEPLGSEWQEVGFLSQETIFGNPDSDDPGTQWFREPSKLEYELTAPIDTQLLGTIFGAKVPHYQGPEHSVLIEYTNTVSGCPPFPKIPRARWWQRAKKRENAATWAAYIKAVDEWHAAGSPDVEVLCRTYVPRAVITDG